MKKPLFLRYRRTAWCLALCAPVALLIAQPGVASAPAGHFTIGTGSLAGTVADNVTGLTWMRTPIDGPIKWAAATTYCADLTFAGYSDWRLPTIKELQTLVDDTRTSPAVDVDAFPALVAASYWSSTLVPWNSNQALTTEFDQGSMGPIDTNFDYRALCVR